MPANIVTVEITDFLDTRRTFLQRQNLEIRVSAIQSC